MADYYPLIARAVGGLDDNTGENRRALYERARTALVNQLRGVDPPLDEDEITRERLALEEAIRRVETEAVTHTASKTSEILEPPAATSLRDQALRSFRETVADAEVLGEGAAEASRSRPERRSRRRPGRRSPRMRTRKKRTPSTRRRHGTGAALSRSR